MFQTYFEDRENGGLYHAVSEDWAEVVDTNKLAEEQFSAARTNVIGAMITHDPEAVTDAEKAVDEVITRFEDKKNGGYYLAADKDWTITQKEKHLCHTSEIFGVLMHLYEVNKKDSYLAKALEFLDIALERAWDEKNGGFFSLYSEDWTPEGDIKDLGTQAAMLQHMNGSWKDGMDSPLGAQSAYHRSRAEAFGDLLIEKAEDRVNGGFYTSFTGDWTPAATEKAVSQIASLGLTLYFHYHNMGPSIWGPRKGSHAYTGRPYPSVYRYLGPAPSVEPVTQRAYLFGKKVMEIGDILIRHAWDEDLGGFYTSLAEDLSPADENKSVSTQIACLMALNVAYRLTGFKRFQQKLAEAVITMEEKCFDPENSGTYVSFDRSWEPTVRDKICGPNLMVVGILSMMAPVSSGMEVAGAQLTIWIGPRVQEIKQNSSTACSVTVQNQGFESKRVRVGGLTTPSRWMSPGDITFDLAPHEVTTYTLTITPPAGMPPGDYFFEVTCMEEGAVAEYAAAGGKLIIR